MNYPEAIFLFFFSFTLPSCTIIIICGFPSGTRRLQSGHVYNETVNFMEDNLHLPLNPQASQLTEERDDKVGKRWTDDDRGVCVCVCGGCAWRGVGGRQGWVAGTAVSTAGRQDNYTRINRIWLLLSGGWWHVRAFVCNGSETVPLNKVYH